MNMQNVLFGVAVLAVLSNVVIWILIMAALDRRGYKTNILWSRFLIFKYLSACKEATRKKTGKPGPLFFLWIGSSNLDKINAVSILRCRMMADPIAGALGDEVQTDVSKYP